MWEPFLCPHRRGTKKEEEESGRQSVLTSVLTLSDRHSRSFAAPAW